MKTFTVNTDENDDWIRAIQPANELTLLANTSNLIILRGGEGSGFFTEDGHRGRPGEVGGSTSDNADRAPDWKTYKVTIGDQAEFDELMKDTTERLSEPLPLSKDSFPYTGKKHECDGNALKVAKAQGLKLYKGTVVYYSDFYEMWTGIMGGHYFNVAEDGTVYDTSPFQKEITGPLFYMGKNVPIKSSTTKKDLWNS